MDTLPRIGIVLSTTRPGRFGDTPAAWLLDLARRRGDAQYELVDLRDHPLPFFEEARSPIMGPIEREDVRRWARVVGGLDGFIFVTAEYNHGLPAVLKNALDYVYTEFNRKPATFVGYGGVGGARAVEHLRGVLGELQVATLKHAVHIGLAEMMGVMKGETRLTDYPHLADAAHRMLDDLVWWTAALGAAREGAVTEL